MLDEDTDCCVNFVETIASKAGRESVHPKSVADALFQECKHVIDRGAEIWLFDCDKTISENDVSYEFFAQLGIGLDTIKQIFRNDRYSTYQFYKFASLYGSKSAEEIFFAAKSAADQLILSAKILEILKSESRPTALGITSGIFPVWQNAQGIDKYLDSLLGSSLFQSPPRLVTPLVKKEFVHLLKAAGKRVVAMGDSMIDVPMLEAADLGLIVAHQKLDKAVDKHFASNQDTRIQQMIINDLRYSNLKSVRELS
jgi:hypothetical protein